MSEKAKKLKLNGYAVNMSNKDDGVILTLSGNTKSRNRYNLEISLDGDYFLGMIDKLVSKMAEEKIQRKEEQISTLKQSIRK